MKKEKIIKETSDFAKNMKRKSSLGEEMSRQKKINTNFFCDINLIFLIVIIIIIGYVSLLRSFSSSALLKMCQRSVPATHVNLFT